MPASGRFHLVSPFAPTGDQPEAIDRLVTALRSGAPAVCLLGATGTGKTFTMANVVAALNRPTLIISHNKTLAAQLYEELKEFFPHNAVHYFVSYYDFYQPEAYIPQRDIYIEKDASRNDDLDQLRLAATSAILSRRDTIVVASVSCIFGLGSPQAYSERVLTLTVGAPMGRRAFLLALAAMQYRRADVDFTRGTYRVRGETIEVWPAYERVALRIEAPDERIERIELIHPLTAQTLGYERQFFLFPATHYVAPEDRMATALEAIREELDQRVAELRAAGRLLEAHRLLARTRYDLELLAETGVCPGVENYARFFDGRAPGERPYTLLDYFEYAPPPDASDPLASASPADDPLRDRASSPALRRPHRRDWLLIIDESHVTIPQIRAMFHSDRHRKEVLVEHGFRLPSALDNRPLTFDEFEAIVPQTMYVSATPGEYEVQRCGGEVVEQIIRPTGLLDPEIEVAPARGQVDDLVRRCRERAARGERVLVTALTKRLCEDLTSYLAGHGLRVRYLHSEIETLERVVILADLRRGDFDVLVGVNLLREGLDLPEVSLVCILDADKEGFLRSPTSLIQQMGRAARNVNATVVMYADRITPAMQAAIEETRRRREKQLAYNRRHGITPRSIVKPLRTGLETELATRRAARQAARDAEPQYPVAELAAALEQEMLEAAASLEFERAAHLRDQLRVLRERFGHEPIVPGGHAPPSAMIRRSELEELLAGQTPRPRAGMPGVAPNRRRRRSPHAR